MIKKDLKSGKDGWIFRRDGRPSVSTIMMCVSSIIFPMMKLLLLLKLVHN